MRLVDDCDEAVQSRLPEIGNIRKGIQRERLRHLPSNPLSIEDLGDLPDVFKKTLGAENFLLYDSLNDAYNKVIEVVIAAAEAFGIPTVHPQAIMSDFELAIVNAMKKNFAQDIIRLCLFHLCQSVYRKVQEKGLQQRYNDPNDNSIRKSSHSMCALAFVHTVEVKDVFDSFYNEVPDDFVDVADYFEVTYIRGIPARGRRRATKERYATALWNHDNSVLNGTAYLQTTRQRAGTIGSKN